MSAYFDFYFERSPICDTHWVFKDEDLRADFCDGARDEKCMPSLQEVRTWHPRDHPRDCNRRVRDCNRHVH